MSWHKISALVVSLVVIACSMSYSGQREAMEDDVTLEGEVIDELLKYQTQQIKHALKLNDDVEYSFVMDQILGGRIGAETQVVYSGTLFR